MKLKNWERLEELARHYHLNINPSKPRESRIAVAMRYDRHEKMVEAIECMTGMPCTEYSPTELLMLTFNRRDSNPNDFYDGFPDVDGE